MRNSFKNSWMFIIILFVSLILPFNVEAKQTNTYIMESDFDYEEFISGDSISIFNSTSYTPVEKQDFKFYSLDKVTKFEYYIIDSIDSNGNIKYKKYDFSNLDKSVWDPKSSTFYSYSGVPYDEIKIDTVDFYNSCQKDSFYIFDDYEWGYGRCNLILPAVNGKISRWRFDSKENSDKKSIDACKYKGYDDLCSSCDEAEGKNDSNYIGTYDFYTSSTYKFYELPDEKPKTKIACDSNNLSAGESTKCKINFSYKYALSNILFDITSDNLKINNLQLNNYWENDDDYGEDYSDSWTLKETDNGYSINFTYDSLVYEVFDKNPLIATFEVTADEDIDDVVKSIEKTDIKYVEKTGDGISKDEEPSSGNVIDNIINPETFKNNYYLIVGIIIIGGISFIQLRSKEKKNK